MLMIFIGFQLWDSSSSWEITASSYFLPTAEKIHNKSTNLLIFNDTGEDGHVMLIHFLHHSESLRVDRPTLPYSFCTFLYIFVALGSVFS